MLAARGDFEKRRPTSLRRASAHFRASISAARSGPAGHDAHASASKSARAAASRAEKK